MANNNAAAFPFATVLGLIFITLKLTGFITWSWLWVLSPFWIPITIVVALFTLAWALGKF